MAQHVAAPTQTHYVEGRAEIEYAITTQALTKRYDSDRLAVDSLDLRVHRGEVYGFLGPNGAGKTTTLRMLLGLIRPSSGTARVVGELPGAPAGLARIGALVEAPAFYPYLSGSQNLRVLADYTGISDSRVAGALERVGLSDRADDKFRSYSLGMKQRLGVAATLMKDPELVILDEPTNGLDPEGIADMRTLVRSIADGGRTVILSSHLLGEVESICDRAGLMRRGKLIAEGTVEELRGRPGLLVRAEPPDRARAIVAALPGVERVDLADGSLRIDIDPARADDINERLVSSGIRVKELRPMQRSLEDVFFALTGDQEVRDAG
jgi:ABC-2 type transport system ATP-binding protein